MLHKTEESDAHQDPELQTAHTSELEDLKNRIEAELARRELEEREPPDGCQVVEERPISAGTLRLERVKCGKDRSKKCKAGEGYGPYWYLYVRRNGKLTSRYIGKMIPDDLVVDS